jgi:hypothetical protein
LPSAVIGKGRQCAQDIVVAEIGTEVAFQSPESGQDLGGHAIFLLHARKQRGVQLDLGKPIWDSTTTDHAIGKLQEGLVEHRLTVIAPNDRLIECHARRCSRDNARRHTLRAGVFLEVLKPALVASGRTAVRGKRLPTQEHTGYEYRKCKRRFSHRSVRLFKA